MLNKPLLNAKSILRSQRPAEPSNLLDSTYIQPAESHQVQLYDQNNQRPQREFAIELREEMNLQLMVYWAMVVVDHTNTQGHMCVVIGLTSNSEPNQTKFKLPKECRTKVCKPRENFISGVY